MVLGKKTRFGRCSGADAVAWPALPCTRTNQPARTHQAEQPRHPRPRKGTYTQGRVSCMLASGGVTGTNVAVLTRMHVLSPLPLCHARRENMRARAAIAREKCCHSREQCARVPDTRRARPHYPDPSFRSATRRALTTRKGARSLP
jgi:hypothetical protein